MYADDNVRVAEALNDAFNRRDMAAAMHLAAEDARFINVATGQSFRGPDGVRQFLEGWATAFPDSRVETSRVIGGPDGAAIEFIGHGTQTGPLSTATGEVPPT